MPTTPAGKAITSRNAVTHGLFAQDLVLAHLGESADDFRALCDGLTAELSPRTALQRHYVQQVAQAMWRLRRLLRWEAHVYDDPDLTDEDRITKMARILRHDNMLRRHIDRALLALSQAPEKCQNEPAPGTGMACHAPTPPALTVAGSPGPPAAGGPCEARNERSKVVGISAIRKARQLKQREKNAKTNPCQGTHSQPPLAPLPFLRGRGGEAGVGDLRAEGGVGASQASSPARQLSGIMNP